jgi:hypothetical protein
MSKKYDSQQQAAQEPPAPAKPAQEQKYPPKGEPKPAHSGFVGTWICQYYDWTENQILPPPKFPLTITQETEETLDGTYPLPGHDAKMWGYLSHGGRLWAGTYKGIQQGTFVFILDDNGQSFHGAWVDDEAEGPPQPWWGTRES